MGRITKPELIYIGLRSFNDGTSAHAFLDGAKEVYWARLRGPLLIGSHYEGTRTGKKLTISNPPKMLHLGKHLEKKVEEWRAQDLGAIEAQRLRRAETTAGKLKFWDGKTLAELRDVRGRLAWREQFEFDKALLAALRRRP